MRARPLNKQYLVLYLIFSVICIILFPISRHLIGIDCEGSYMVRSERERAVGKVASVMAAILVTKTGALLKSIFSQRLFVATLGPF